MKKQKIQSIPNSFLSEIQKMRPDVNTYSIILFGLGILLLKLAAYLLTQKPIMLFDQYSPHTNAILERVVLGSMSTTGCLSIVGGITLKLGHKTAFFAVNHYNKLHDDLRECPLPDNQPQPIGHVVREFRSLSQRGLIHYTGGGDDGDGDHDCENHSIESSPLFGVLFGQTVCMTHPLEVTSAHE